MYALLITHFYTVLQMSLAAFYAIVIIPVFCFVYSGHMECMQINKIMIVIVFVFTPSS